MGRERFEVVDASKTRLDYFLTIRLSAFPRQISDY